MWILEYIGVAFGLGGSLILSLNGPRWTMLTTWLLWILSSLILLIFYQHSLLPGLLFGQGMTLISSGLGIIRWWKPNVNQREMQRISLAGVALCAVVFGLACILGNQLPPPELLQWLGASAVSAGAFLMAANIPQSKYAWVVWTVGNLLMIIVSWQLNLYGILTMNAVYLGTAIIGLWRWLASAKAKNS